MTPRPLLPYLFPPPPQTKMGNCPHSRTLRQYRHFSRPCRFAVEFHGLTIVRNEGLATSWFGMEELARGIMTVEADVASNQGVRNVVETIRRGELPAFRHGFAASALVGLPQYTPADRRGTYTITYGELFEPTSIPDLTTEDIRTHSSVNLEPNLGKYDLVVGTPGYMEN